MSVVEEAVADGIGDRWISDVIVSLLDRELAGDDGGAGAVAIVNDLGEIALFGKRSNNRLRSFRSSRDKSGNATSSSAKR